MQRNDFFLYGYENWNFQLSLYEPGDKAESLRGQNW